MNFAVIINNNKITKWQKDCLNYLTNKKNLNMKLILNCKDSRSYNIKFQHLFYYFINFFCLKNKQTKKFDFDFKKKIDFYSIASKKTTGDLFLNH